MLIQSQAVPQVSAQTTSDHNMSSKKLRLVSTVGHGNAVSVYMNGSPRAAGSDKFLTVRYPVGTLNRKVKVKSGAEIQSLGLKAALQTSQIGIYCVSQQ